jgi:hypothetical protein
VINGKPTNNSALGRAIHVVRADPRFFFVFARFISGCFRRSLATAQKNDVAEYPEVFDHVGLLIN